MFHGLIFLLMAPQDAAAPNPLTMFVPMILIFAVIYLFIIRPQKKKEDTRKAMVAAAKKGDRVVTIGGLHGKVIQVDETSVLLEVDGSVKLRYDKAALASISD
jgi:preprotein translocase subunit YajC